MDPCRSLFLVFSGVLKRVLLERAGFPMPAVHGTFVPLFRNRGRTSRLLVADTRARCEPNISKLLNNVDQPHLNSALAKYLSMQSSPNIKNLRADVKIRMLSIQRGDYHIRVCAIVLADHRSAG